jgi:DNA repair exonuclease SbcCD nuclease subunit
MKIALINDTHAGARGDNVVFNEFFFKFWENTFFPYLEKNNIKTICHLGDVVDRRKFINFATLNSWRSRFFDRARDLGVQLEVIVGNHDVTYKNTNELNAMTELFSHYNNINIYTEPTDLMFDGLSVAMVPWINGENYEQSMEFLANTKSQVVFGHFEISGFEMDRGNVCQGGMSREAFNRFDMVMSGHFHHKSNQGSIYYLGNQYEMSWADYGDTRGFHVFDTDTRELEFVANPYHIFHKYSYNDTTDAEKEAIKKFDYSAYKDMFVKVVVVNKTEPILFDNMIDSLYKAGVLDVSIVEDLSVDSTTNTDELINQAEDTITILNKYIDGMTLDVDNNKLKNHMRELYVEALNLQRIE